LAQQCFGSRTKIAKFRLVSEVVAVIRLFEIYVCGFLCRSLTVINQFKTQCKGDVSHASKTVKITVSSVIRTVLRHF